MFSTKARVESRLLLQRIRIKSNKASNNALKSVLALVRTNSIRSLRRRAGPSSPGTPPSHHAKSTRGLKAILFSISGNVGIIGPIKFRWSNFFNKPATHIQEFGGTFRSKFDVFRYPERSFMYEPTRVLARRGLLNKKFAFSLGRTL